MSMPTTDSLPAPGPFQSLLAQARARPRSEALRAKRRGAWHAFTWSRLAADAHRAARAWDALGVLPGDTIVALGPLSAELVVTLFAVDALGATIAFALPGAEARLIADSRFAFAHGTHEFERLMRHRRPRLTDVVAADADTAATETASGLRLHSAESLLAAGAALMNTPMWEPPAAHSRAALACVHDAQGDPQAVEGGVTSMSPQSGFESHRVLTSDGVLADFDPTWLPGLSFVMHRWPEVAAHLLIPEPGGEPTTDRREAHATVWLAPAHGLVEFAETLAARVSASGLGGHVARAVLQGRPTWLGGWARTRIKVNMGVGQVRQVLSDAPLPEAMQNLWVALGLMPQAADTGTATGAAAQRRPAEPPHAAPTAGRDRALAGTLS